LARCVAKVCSFAALSDGPVSQVGSLVTVVVAGGGDRAGTGAAAVAIVGLRVDFGIGMNGTQGEGRGRVTSDKMRYRGWGSWNIYVTPPAVDPTRMRVDSDGVGGIRQLGSFVGGGVVKWVGGGDGIRKVGGWAQLQGISASRVSRHSCTRWQFGRQWQIPGRGRSELIVMLSTGSTFRPFACDDDEW
jgi:hypothetical protein